MESILESIKLLGDPFLPIGVFIFIVSGIIYFQKDKVYRYPASGWLDIKKHPLPHDIKKYLGTDGKKVDYFFGIAWGPQGDVLFDTYTKTHMTHWQPLPDVPTKE